VSRLGIPTLSNRLIRMNLLVSGSVLLIAALAFFSYDLYSYRQLLARNIDAEAQIVGENAVAALLFNDRDAATTTLNGLQRSPDIVAATLLTPDGKPFAHYGTSEAPEAGVNRLAAHETDQVWTSGTRVAIAHRIVFHDQTVGVVWISARLTEIGQRVRRYSLITGLILLLSMAAGSAISSVSQRSIAGPIVSLADTALVVSRGQDYSLRSNVKPDTRELTILVDAFNTMIGQVQERDSELNEARNSLELRVEQRTIQLKNANKELEAFSYSVAHDLRGSLEAISNIAFLLAEDDHVVNNDAIQPMLAMLRHSTTAMAELIEDLLNLARATGAPVSRAPVSLTALARDIAGQLATADPQRDVEFVIGNLPEINADAGLMRIVLDNLLRNAWKYTSHHARARIEFGAKSAGPSNGDSNGLIYFVRDDGAGFNPEQSPKLFELFHRLHDGGQFPGMGIGLATVRRVIERQGGSIWAEGAVEKGATFYFTLDRSAEEWLEEGVHRIA